MSGWASTLAHATAIGMPQLGSAPAQLAPRFSPQSSSEGGLRRAQIFDGLRRQILVQLAASSLLHLLLQSELSRQELRNRLQFHLRSLICRGTRTLPHCTRRPGIRHPVAGGCTSKTSRWGPVASIRNRRLALRSTSDVGSPATAHQRTIRSLGAVNDTDAGRADAAAEPVVALTVRLLTSAQHRWRGRWQQPGGPARR